MSATLTFSELIVGDHFVCAKPNSHRYVFKKTGTTIAKRLFVGDEVPIWSLTPVIKLLIADESAPTRPERLDIKEWGGVSHLPDWNRDCRRLANKAIQIVNQWQDGGFDLDQRKQVLAEIEFYRQLTFVMNPELSLADAAPFMEQYQLMREFVERFGQPVCPTCGTKQ